MSPRRPLNLYHAVKLKEDLQYAELCRIFEFLGGDKRIPKDAQVTFSRDVNPGITTMLITWEGNESV